MIECQLKSCVLSENIKLSITVNKRYRLKAQINHYISKCLLQEGTIDHNES